jgi:hypothetical protein
LAWADNVGTSSYIRLEPEDVQSSHEACYPLAGSFYSRAGIVYFLLQSISQSHAIYIYLLYIVFPDIDVAKVNGGQGVAESGMQWMENSCNQTDVHKDSLGGEFK